MLVWDLLAWTGFSGYVCPHTPECDGTTLEEYTKSSQHSTLWQTMANAFSGVYRGSLTDYLVNQIFMKYALKILDKKSKIDASFGY